MNGVSTFGLALWALAFSLNAALVLLLLYRNKERIFRLFFLYALLNLLHNVIVFASYRFWGFRSAAYVQIFWTTQALVIMARAAAVAEISYCILAKYRGVWKLAWRLQLAAAGLVFLYSWMLSRGSWQFAILNTDRGLELVIAAVIVVLFLFTRYYEVSVEPTVRTLAVGFFLYSCSRVVNDTILERLLSNYSSLWNLLGTLTFLASLLLWTWALRKPQIEARTEQTLLPAGVYQTVAPQINRRLRLLNEQLSQLWNADIEGKGEGRETKAET